MMAETTVAFSREEIDSFERHLRPPSISWSVLWMSLSDRQHVRRALAQNDARRPDR